MRLLVRDGHLDVADKAALDNAMRASLAAANQIDSIVFGDPQLQGRLWVRLPNDGVVAVAEAPLEDGGTSEAEYDPALGTAAAR